ncbi:MAG: RDD family protein [Bacteroidetes bacterium]|nr:MAG: RDD family protein [Bacteroidota bacterium]
MLMSMILDDGFQEDSNYKLVEASKGKRLANYLIDGLIAQFFSFIAGMILGLSGSDEGQLFASLAGIAVYVGYYILFEHLNNGRTIGKIVTRTKVVTQTGGSPTVDSLIGRSFARLIPFEAFSFLGERNNGWHDRLSKTMVIDLDESELPLENDLL